MSRATAIWLVLALLSGGLAARQILLLTGEPRAQAEAVVAMTRSAPAASPAEASPPAAPVPILSRPLFARKAPPPPPPKPAPAPPRVDAKPIQTLRLAGVIIDGERRLALVEERPGQPSVKVGEGGVLGPWTVIRVDSREALLRRGEEDLLLKLDPQRQ